MRQSKVEQYSHVVWKTKRAAEIITPAMEPAIHAVIRARAAKLGCQVIAVNGMPDHIHMLARIPATVCLAYLAQKVKGASSRYINLNYKLDEPFRWQEGYGAFSVSRSHVARVTRYIESQKLRHAKDDLWPEWEETDEDYVPAP